MIYIAKSYNTFYMLRTKPLPYIHFSPLGASTAAAPPGYLSLSANHRYTYITHIHTHTHTHSNMFLSIYPCVCVCVCVCARADISVRLRIPLWVRNTRYKHTHTHIHTTHTHTCTYEHTRTHARTHTHTHNTSPTSPRRSGPSFAGSYSSVQHASQYEVAMVTLSPTLGSATKSSPSLVISIPGSILWREKKKF